MALQGLYGIRFAEYCGRIEGRMKKNELQRKRHHFNRNSYKN